MPVDPAPPIRSTEDDPIWPSVEPLLRPVMIRRRWVRAGALDPQHVTPDDEPVLHVRRAA